MPDQPGPADVWLLESLHRLARLTLRPEVADAFVAAPIQMLSRRQVEAYVGEPAILIPVDITAPIKPERIGRVPFGTTEVTMCNPITEYFKEWDPADPLGVWRRNSSGALTMAWNLWATGRDVLSLREEVECTARDDHGRFSVSCSNRHDSGLLQVPLVNELLALLLDAWLHLSERHSLLGGVEDYVLPPMVMLSHDCDSLVGSGLWDQLGRATRLMDSRRAADLSRLRQAKLIGVNAIAPRRYYLDDLAAMWRREMEYGFVSTSYILNGRGGRFGARTPFKVSSEVIRSNPPGFEIGVHYNYAYLQDEGSLLRSQIDAIEGVGDRDVIAGRAHYLKLDPERDWRTLIDHGIKVDESLGWITHNAYRAGIAGPFKPFDQSSGSEADLVEMPLVFSDGSLAADPGPSSWRAMLRHVAKIGGGVSVLIHPGAFDSPERPDMFGVYDEVLRELKSAGARSFTPSSLLEALG